MRKQVINLSQTPEACQIKCHRFSLYSACCPAVATKLNSPKRKLIPYGFASESLVVRKTKYTCLHDYFIS